MIHGQITAADLIAYLLYVTTLLASIRRIVEFTEQFQRGITGIERFIRGHGRARGPSPTDPDAAELTDVRRRRCTSTT